ncbi:unnamed protein product, partial [Urochloa humidicola]
VSGVFLSLPVHPLPATISSGAPSALHPRRSVSHLRKPTARALLLLGCYPHLPPPSGLRTLPAAREAHASRVHDSMQGIRDISPRGQRS